MIIFCISCDALAIVHSGESVPESERTSEKELTDTLSASSSTHNLPSISKALVPGVPVAALSDEERILFEEEKLKLYQQMDDKVCTCLSWFDTFTNKVTLFLCFFYQILKPLNGVVTSEPWIGLPWVVLHMYA